MCESSPHRRSSGEALQQVIEVMCDEMHDAGLELAPPPPDCPYWPCTLFTVDDEIVGALWWDAEPLFPELCERREPRGWTIHVLADSSPDVDDYLGDEDAPHVALAIAVGAVAMRMEPLGLTYEQSLHRLLWAPVCVLAAA